MKVLKLFLFLAMIPQVLESQGLIPYYNPIGKDWGYCDFDKKSVIWTQFDEAGFFDFGAAIVKDHDFYGVINTSGDYVAEPVYLKIYPFYEGYAAVLSKENKIGFINWAGKFIVPCTYEYDKYYDYEFSDGLAAISVDGKWGYLDATGKMVISPVYSRAHKFMDSTAIVKDDTYKIIDVTGKVLADLKQYDSVDDYGEGLFGVSKGKKSGYVDKTGKLIIPMSFTSVYKFSEGLAFVKKGDKMFFIDKTGKTVFALKCDEMYAVKFSEGLCPIEKDNKMGYIDKTGTIVIPCNWDIAREFSYGHALVGNSYFEDGNFGSICGVIDREGRLVLPLKYRNSGSDEDYKMGLIRFREKDLFGYTFVDGTDFSDTYLYYTIKPPVPPEPTAADYPKYIVGYYKNFRMTDNKGYLYQYTGGYNDKCEITDKGNGMVHLNLYIETTKEMIVGDGYNHTWSGDFDFIVSYGELGGGFSIGDTKGFVLNDFSKIPGTGNVDSVFGYYNVKSNELTIYIGTSDKTTMKITAKRDFNRR
jgi:hypothetical protein